MLRSSLSTHVDLVPNFGRLGDWIREVISDIYFGIPPGRRLAAGACQLPFILKCMYMFDVVLPVTSFARNAHNCTLKFLQSPLYPLNILSSGL